VSKQDSYQRLCFRAKQNGPISFTEFDNISSATKALNKLYGHELSNSIEGGLWISYFKSPLGVRTRPTPVTSSVELLKPPRHKPIKCICGVEKDEEEMLQCEECGTWQHIGCSAVLKEEIVEVHECDDCTANQIQEKFFMSLVAAPPEPRPDKKRIGRRRLPPLEPGPALKFVVADHPDDFRAGNTMRSVRSHSMYKVRQDRDTIKSHEANRATASTTHPKPSPGKF
jgi:hypothetical protein